MAFSQLHASLAAAGAVLFLAAHRRVRACAVVCACMAPALRQGIACVHACSLANSTTFRVASGGTIFTVFFVAIVLYYTVSPLQRNAARAFFVLSTFTTLSWHWLIETLTPNWTEGVRAPYLLSFPAAVFLIGSAITYVLDSPSGPYHDRMEDVIALALRAAGLACVCLGAWRVARGARMCSCCGRRRAR